MGMLQLPFCGCSLSHPAWRLTLLSKSSCFCELLLPSYIASHHTFFPADWLMPWNCSRACGTGQQLRLPCLIFFLVSCLPAVHFAAPRNPALLQIDFLDLSLSCSLPYLNSPFFGRLTSWTCSRACSMRQPLGLPPCPASPLP